MADSVRAAKIQKTREHIQYLERELQIALSYLTGLQFGLPHPLESPSSANDAVIKKYPPRIAGIKQMLIDAKKPLHLNEIIDSLNLPVEEKERKKLSFKGALNWYCRRGQVFTKEGKNIFGLKQP